jgi:homoserine O-acetyltransferase
MSIGTTDIGIVTTQYFHSTRPLELQSGLVLPELVLAYETYGVLNANRDNAVLLLHALSGDAHAAGRHSASEKHPGWWDAMVGPGKAFDTDKYFVICSNVIGGCKGSTGPISTNPATGTSWQATFPVVTIQDMVQAQTHLIDALGIDVLVAVAGGSMGGFQALEWMARYSHRVQKGILLATSASHSAQAIAWNAIGRQAITRDPLWCDGFYPSDAPPVHGLAVARMIGHITYLSDQSLQKRFPQRYQHGTLPSYTLTDEFGIESYLKHQADKFNQRFDANSYLYITKAMDYWNVARDQETLDTALAGWRGQTLVISFDSDMLYPTSESLRIVTALQQNNTSVEFHELSSIAGHDAFLLESETQTPLIHAFLKK